MNKNIIPSFIYRKRNIFSLVIFTALFALLFINLYEPFNSSEWYNITDFEYFFYSSLLILAGVFIVVISRIILYKYTKKNQLSYYAYAGWIFCEILAMATTYAFISYTLDNEVEFAVKFKAALKNTALVLLLPYFIMHLYFTLQEKKRLLTEIEETKVSYDAKIYTFYDSRGELRLSIAKDSLLYIKADDNYLEIKYLGKKGISSYLLRNTLKNIEDQLVDNNNVIRCHRSYMVNLNKLQVAKRTTNGIFLDLGIDGVPEIPVSKSYGDKVTKWLLSEMK